MKEEETVIKLVGVSPEEIPHGKEARKEYGLGKYGDEAHKLADHIFDYIREEMHFDVDSVQVVVNEEAL